MDLFSQSPSSTMQAPPRRITYINSLAVDVSAGRGSRGRSVGDSVGACLADVNLRGRDF